MKFYGSILSLFVIVFFLVGCGPKKSIHELNPTVQFMNKTEVINFLSNSKTESPNTIITYKSNGTANIYVKRIDKDILANWKVEDDGMIILRTNQRTDKYYISSDGITSYNLKGENMRFKKI